MMALPALKRRKVTDGLPSTFLFNEPPFDEPFANLMLNRALQDASQSADLGLRHEARAWLWVCCPDVADQLELTVCRSI